MRRSEIDGLNLFVVFDLLRSALLEDAPVMHHRHVARNPQRDVEIVLDDDVADMRRQHIEDFDQIAPLRRRKTGGGLIKQNEPRPTAQPKRYLELTLRARDTHRK